MISLAKFRRRDDPEAPSRSERGALFIRQHPVLIAVLILSVVMTVLAVFTIQAVIDSRHAATSARAAAASAQRGEMALRGVVARESRDRRAAVAANVAARRDDCRNSNRLRKALRKDAVQAQKTLPLLLKLVPQLDTPQVRELVASNSASRLKAYKRRDCDAYAREALP